MTATQTTPLQTLDLSAIIGRVQDEHNFDADTLTTAETLYRQFLWLHKKYPNKNLVPPRLVDEVWHQHILDSRKYEEDCQSLFGSFMHHHPGLSDADKESGIWEETKTLYAKEFGTDLDALGLDGALCKCHKCQK